MTLDEIVALAYPITQRDCHIMRATKSRMREALKQYILMWRKEENAREGLTSPDKTNESSALNT